MATHGLPTRGTKRKSDSLEPPDNDHDSPTASSSHIKPEPTDTNPDDATSTNPADNTINAPNAATNETMNPTHLADLGHNLQILPVPEDGDNLEDTARKLAGLAQVVQDGNSLALWTGLQLSSTPAAHGRDPEAIARSQMTEVERMMYDGWRGMKRQKREHRSSTSTSTSSGTVNGGDGDGDGAHGRERSVADETPPLPTSTDSPLTFDWEANKAPVPQGKGSEKRFRQRAAAMDVIFDHQGATPEHAAWLTFHMVHALPLVKAVIKVMNQRRHLREQGQLSPGLTDMEAMELETVRKAIYVAEKNRCREMERIRRMTKSVMESVAVLQMRMKALEKP